MARSERDVAIIGAGPVGLFAVFQCGMLGLHCAVIDALEAPGGQCTALYPEKPIYDIPAHPAILAGELIEQLAAQAAPFAPAWHLGQRVERLERAKGGWRLGTSAGDEIACRAVMIAAGAGAFGPKRPPLEGLEAYEAGGGVRYFVRRREDFRGKRVVIAGGGDSAVDWALSLAEVAASVALVHRRSRLRAAPAMAARLAALAEAGRIELVSPWQLAGLEGDGGRLASVLLRDLEGRERRLAADVLLPFYGLAMELGPIADWGLALQRGQLQVEPVACATAAPGIFAIGDVAHYPGKLKLILTGFAEAAAAAHAARDLIHPDQPLHFAYSTTRGVPAL